MVRVEREGAVYIFFIVFHFWKVLMLPAYGYYSLARRMTAGVPAPGTLLRMFGAFCFERRIFFLALHIFHVKFPYIFFIKFISYKWII